MNRIRLLISRKNLEPLKSRVADLYNTEDLYISDFEECNDDEKNVYINVFYKVPDLLFWLGQDVAFVDLFGYK